MKKELDIPANNLSFHLKVLAHASLATVEQEERFLRYRASIEIMHAVVLYLTSECACSDPDLCLEMRKMSGILMMFNRETD